MGNKTWQQRGDMVEIHAKEVENLKRIIGEITVANDILKRVHIDNHFFIILVFCYSMSRDNKIILSIAVFVLVVLATVFVIIPAYLLRQSDDLLTITYYCAFKMTPNSFAAWKSFDNGTHTVDIDSCKWLKNKSADP